LDAEEASESEDRRDGAEGGSEAGDESGSGSDVDDVILEAEAQTRDGETPYPPPVSEFRYRPERPFARLYW